MHLRKVVLGTLFLVVAVGVGAAPLRRAQGEAAAQVGLTPAPAKIADVFLSNTSDFSVFTAALLPFPPLPLSRCHSLAELHRRMVLWRPRESKRPHPIVDPLRVSPRWPSMPSGLTLFARESTH
jgi:hypothetical protein